MNIVNNLTHCLNYYLGSMKLIVNSKKCVFNADDLLRINSKHIKIKELKVILRVIQIKSIGGKNENMQDSENISFLKFFEKES